MTAQPPDPQPPPHDLRGLLAVVTAAAVLSAAGGLFAGDRAIGAVSVVLAAASMARLVSAPSPRTRSRVIGVFVRTLLTASLLAVSIAGSLLAAEGLTRWVYRDVTTTADFRGYFTTKWLRTQVRHNHYDYRGGEFDEIAPAGLYRVAVMGDSYTYGNGVAEDQRFSNRVGAALRPHGVEVLNFGFPGNNWPEHVKTLERRVLRLKPDFVLLQWGTNDVELDRDVAARPHVPPLVSNRDLHESLYRVSALYTILNAQWIRLQLTRQMGDTYPGYMARLYSDPNSEGARQAAALMRRFVELCRQRGIGVGIVMFPDAGVSLGPDYPYRFLHDRMHALCIEQTVQCLDLLPLLTPVEGERALWASPLDSHPNALANRIAADAILKTFAPAWGGRESAGGGR